MLRSRPSIRPLHLKKGGVGSFQGFGVSVVALFGSGSGPAPTLGRRIRRVLRSDHNLVWRCPASSGVSGVDGPLSVQSTTISPRWIIIAISGCKRLCVTKYMYNQLLILSGGTFRRLVGGCQPTSGSGIVFPSSPCRPGAALPTD